MTTLRLACRCGASLTQTDQGWRCAESEEAFRHGHTWPGCAVSVESERMQSRLVSEIKPEPMPDVPLFHTEAGILVEARGEPVMRGKFLKVECYRPRTGGFMGLLKVCNLTPQNNAALALSARVRPT